MRFSVKVTPWLFVAPWLLGLVLLTALPFGLSLWWSFCRYSLLDAPEYVGLENYRRLAGELRSGEGAARAVWNTAYYAIWSVALSVVLGVLLAVMASWPVRGRNIFRALVFFPSVLPVVATSVVWMWLLEPRGGPVNALLAAVGLPGPGWLKSAREALWPGGWFTGEAGWGSKDALVLMSLWGVGNFMMIYLAALGEIPRSLYEAAELDGCGPLRRFRHVTLPLLSPVIFFNLVMGLIRAVQAFTQIYLVSEGRGAPLQSTLMLSLHVFLSAFSDLEMGYASAVSWILFVLLAAATLLLFRSARYWVFYAGRFT